MSDVLSDGLAGLRDRMPAMPSATDARDAVRSHLPSIDEVDLSAITDRLPTRKSRKRSKPRLLVALLGLAGGAAALLVVRRKREAKPLDASIYTPPLPKP